MNNKDTTTPKKKRAYSNEIQYNIPLPHIDLDKPKYVITIRYQKPRKIILRDRFKTSPRYDTLYGVMYWLNKQPYNLEFFLFRTDKPEVIREGKKKAGEVIK